MRHDRPRPAFVAAATAAAALIFAVPSLAAVAPPPVSAHALDRHLPAEPLLAFSLAVGEAAVGTDELQHALGRLLDEDRRALLSAWIASFEASLGFDLDRHLLPAIGPQIALSLDFPPIDGMLAAAQLPDTAGLAPIFARCGVVAAVRDRAALEAALDELTTTAAADASPSGEVHRLELSLGPASPGEAPTLSVFHAVHGDVFAVGLDPSWVRRAVMPPADGPSLADGADFSRVFSNLDAVPSSWSYVNLPRLRRWLAESQIVALLASGDATVASVVSPLLDPAMAGVGVGWTTILRDGGVRTTRFGPSWTTGLVLSGGVLAAMVMAESGDADERTAIRQTLGTIREIGDACEQFSGDVDGYPGPTEGWVPVERIAMFLEPVYAPQLPRTDAWDNPILYWSDGSSYRLISLGRDGRMDRDWHGVVDAQPGESPDSDILFADGRFVVLPPQIVSE